MAGVVVVSARTWSPALHRRLAQGLPYTALVALQRRLALSLAAVAALAQIPPRTLARRKAAGKLLPAESERVHRFECLVAAADALFEGDHAAALAWLAAPNRALDGEAPLDVARTEVGARAVDDLIARLEHGVFA